MKKTGSIQRILMIVLLYFVTIHLIGGFIYHERARYCYELRCRTGVDAACSGNPNSVLTLGVDILFWPRQFIGEAINRIGVFDCRE